MRHFRNDDILQVEVFSHKQGRRLNPKIAFDLFKECDKIFERYDYPCILAVLSEGIDYYPEWVEYIKKNKHRYQIELHGSKHYYYNSLSEEEGYKDLKQAKEKIEKEFGVKVTTWVVPHGVKKSPEWGLRVCKKLGLEIAVLSNPKNPYMFHFWHKGQVARVKRMIENA